jgi:thiamine biosynthesis lipoprotein
VTSIATGALKQADCSAELSEILAVAEKTKRETNGYFDVWHDGVFDPSGIVKGWAIQEAARLLGKYTTDYYVEAGGDIQVSGMSAKNEQWKIGVRNPFDRTQNVAVVTLRDEAIATSGTAIRGAHIYNPHGGRPQGVASLSVIGKDIIDADRYATAAFAMGYEGIQFIESLPGFEGFMIDEEKQATQTSGWQAYEMSTS